MKQKNSISIVLTSFGLLFYLYSINYFYPYGLVFIFIITFFSLQKFYQKIKIDTRSKVTIQLL